MSAVASYRAAEIARRATHSAQVRRETSYAVWRSLAAVYHRVDPFHAQVVSDLVAHEAPIAGEMHRVYRTLRAAGYGRTNRPTIPESMQVCNASLKRRSGEWRRMAVYERLREYQPAGAVACFI